MRRLTVLGLAVLLLATLAPIASQAHSVVDRAEVTSLENGAAVGRSRMARTPSGHVRAVVNTTDLRRGDVYTLWVVIFRNPDACDGPCDGGDLANPAVEASSQLADGLVARSRRGSFRANLNPGEAPTGAEIHFVIRSHGPEREDLLDEQLGSLNGGCPPNACANVQAAIHLP